MTRTSARRALWALPVAALLAYGALDVADVTPGLVTLAPPPAPAPPPPLPTPTVRQPVATTGPGPLPTAGPATAVPTTAGLRRALGPLLTQPGLGQLGVTVRDASTGAHLLDTRADVPLIPASTVKLLAAAAVDTTFPAGATLTTRAVRGAAPGTVVLVAGGDTLLAPGRGTPGAVVGRAGLGDLAASTASALRASGRTSVRVSLDARYAAGPPTAHTWGSDYRPSGITGAVAAIGLSTQRATPGRPGPADPGASVLAAFVTALRAAGVSATADAAAGRAPTGAVTLGSVASAPVADQLVLALQDSDDALTESLARQAAARARAGTGFAAVGAWVRQQVQRLGVDVAGVQLLDASGLSRGSRVPVRAIGDVLGLAAARTGPPSLRATIADLAVAGLDGTLSGRFDDATTAAARGVVRAKTGTLTGVSGLAGTVTTPDGRVLVFALVANEVPATTGTPGARRALDGFVTVLARCGCR